MSGKHSGEFAYPLYSNYLSPGIPRWIFGECEISILWALAREGQLAVYDLFRVRGKPRRFILPTLSELREAVETIGKEKPRSSVSYFYPFILKTVRNLEKQMLVHTSRDTSGIRSKRIVALHLLGLLLYLRGSNDEGKFVNAVKKNGRLLPFSGVWDLLNEKLGSEHVKSALGLAVDSFTGLSLAKFIIRPLNLEFDGLITRRWISEGHNNRVEKAVEFLKHKEALELLNSYIAYLAVHDIQKLMEEKKKMADVVPDNLESERELAYFERRDTDSRQLFKEGRIKQFFPKYAQVDFFFTGMLVENLIWHTPTNEAESKLKQETTYEAKRRPSDFEVEF
jgi:hypothetical protein